MAAKKNANAITPVSGEIMPPEVKAELEAKHGGPGSVLVFRHPDGTVAAFRRANRQDVSLYKSRLRREDDNALDGLLLSCLVWPERQSFAAYLEKYPFASNVFADAFKAAQGDGVAHDADAVDLEGHDEIVSEAANHGEVRWAVLRGQLFCLKVPTRDTVRQFNAEVRRKNYAIAEEKILFEPHVVYPRGAELSVFIESNLFAIQVLADKVAEIGGMGGGEAMAVK